MDHPVAYVSGLFRGSQLNWAALTKEAFTIYMSVKKLSFYLTDTDVLLKSDHLPLKKFLQKNTLNNKVNNWAMELEAFNIRFEHVSSKANILADTLSHLVDIDPDARLDFENARWEFGYYVFESLPKLSGEYIVQICEILSSENVIRPNPDIQQPFIQQLRSPLTLNQLCTLQAQDDKCTTLTQMLENGKLDPVAYSLQEGICHASARPPAFLPTTPHFPFSLEGMWSHKAPSGYRLLNGANGLGQNLDSSRGFWPQPIRGLPAIEPGMF